MIKIIKEKINWDEKKKFFSREEQKLIKEHKEELDDIYCELRGLLKKHAQFPDMWDTDERLKDWLKSKGELD